MDMEYLRELISDHSKHPRNKRILDSWTHTCDGKNPLCGDQISIMLQVVDQRVITASFQGRGCGISQASASLLTEAIQGLSVHDCESLYDKLHDSILDHTSLSLSPALHDVWVEIEPLTEIRNNPMRVKCVTLAWHTLHHALNGEQSASTED